MTIRIGINGFGRIGRNIFRAASAVSLVIPQLKGKFDGMSVRVPTPVGSMTDTVYLTKKNVDENKVKGDFWLIG